ncbi:MAG: hypothetical protein NT094_03880, partial [Candidatus Staskawiczbacteria bacterium]|nr:hypothetical protein [Candidatus Staskawiczbacteria bacterium]
MKNKLIIFFSLIAIIFFVPLVSFAYFAPLANLTIVTNVQGQERSVSFNLEKWGYIEKYDETKDTCKDCAEDDENCFQTCNNGYVSYYGWDNYDNFLLQTENLSALKTITVVADDRYKLLQDNVDGLKINNIFCTSDNPNDVFWYEKDSVSFNPIERENITCTFSNVKDKTPVLIVPGITGTELKKGDEKLWADITRIIVDPSDSFLDVLQFNKNLTPTNFGLNTGSVISKEIIDVGVGNVSVFDYTDGLINEFEGQGYVENESLFTFPYDWRYGVSGKYSDGKTNSDLLAQKIQAIMTQTGADKVDVIAHSMGGLITKQYVMNNPTDNHIGKAIFVGVPNTGAPKAVKALVQGDNFGISFGPVGLNDQELKKIAQNMPAIYDLLPSQQYYNTAGSFVSKIDIGYGIGEPTEKDLNYQDFSSYLAEKNTNAQAILNAQTLHTESFDNFDMRASGVDLYSIDGCKTGTMANFLEVKYKDILGNYHTEYDNIKLKTGDGTVPMLSSTNLPIDQNKKYYALSSNHSKLLSADGSRQEIVNLIAGSSLPVSSNLITQDISQCQLTGKIIEIFSPVDIVVTDQSGNKMGLANGNVINNIPNASYEVMGEHKFLYLPQDNGQTYNINLQGTGEGIFTIKVKDMQNSQVVQTENFVDIPVTPALTGTVNLAGQTSLMVQQNPDSQSQTILPTNTKDYDDFMPVFDTTPPEAIIQFDHVKKDLVFSSSENNVSVQDKDNVIILTDKVGNTTEIDLKAKNRKILMQAEVKAIKYNGVVVDVSKNKMAFLWLFDKNNNLKMLSQHVQNKNGYNILAVYNGKNTSLIGKDSSGKILKSVSGLKLIKITTNKG